MTSIPPGGAVTGATAAAPSAVVPTLPSGPTPAAAAAAVDLVRHAGIEALLCTLAEKLQEADDLRRRLEQARAGDPAPGGRDDHTLRQWKDLERDISVLAGAIEQLKAQALEPGPQAGAEGR